MIELKQHDTARPLTDTLTLGGTPINLTGAAVSLIFKNRRTLKSIKRAAVIVSAPAGTVKYQPVAEDVADQVEFDLEWEIVFADSTQLTVPTSGYTRLRINSDLA
jgi:hypothetical protein